jgi:Ser/Thr protein kinase RdoA (MazF antagonist)
MEYARQHGYPVPAVERVSGDGTELVMQRIDGPSLVGAIERRPWTVRQLGTLLADLHLRLHDIPAPDFVPAGPLGDGDRLLHLDLHPLNVIIGPAGPVVIDWTGAASGEPALDIGIAWLLMAAGEVPAAAWKRPLAALARANLLSSWSAPNFPDSGFVVNSRCGLPFQELIADLLRGPVLKSGVPTF